MPTFSQDVQRRRDSVPRLLAGISTLTVASDSHGPQTLCKRNLKAEVRYSAVFFYRFGPILAQKQRKLELLPAKFSDTCAPFSNTDVSNLI